MTIYKKEISKSESKFKLSEFKVKSYKKTQQSTYNVPEDFFKYAIENGILVEGSDLENYPRQDDDIYVLNENYSFKLGSSVLGLIGDEWDRIDNKFIVSKSKSQKEGSEEKSYKPQMYKTVYENLGPDYKWFVELYTKNFYGTQIVFDLIEKNNLLTFDIRLFNVKSYIYENSIHSDYSYNKIIFGAPGTGKSYKLNKDKDELLGNYENNYERVTFHPDYSYANFVGTYKPVINEENEEEITYKYVPGPFMRILVDALKKGNKSKRYLLIIEEINRANVAAVFGDIFQLLDRDEYGLSEYPIQTSEDMRQYLKDKLGGDIEDYKTISLPPNLFIWATMNSADQGVFPMDTAFKRRWDFEYIGINDEDACSKIKDKTVKLGENEIKWDCLRRSINNELLKYKINEDKLLGPFFIPLKYLDDDSDNNSNFLDIFINKVIMYLFEDVAKSKRDSLFNKNLKTKGYWSYSNICNNVNNLGVEIFCENIIEEYNKLK